MSGLASHVGGSGAGLYTAIDIAKKNEQISKRNEERIKSAAKTCLEISDLEYQAKKNRSKVIDSISSEYVADLSWSPNTLFSKIKFHSIKLVLDDITGAISVFVSWKKDDLFLCIDGAIRAKLYTERGEYAGCAYLILPEEGTKEVSGELHGVCPYPKPALEYEMVLEPIDLWEIRKRDSKPFRQTDNLSDEQHRRIVAEYRQNYEKEI